MKHFIFSFITLIVLIISCETFAALGTSTRELEVDVLKPQTADGVVISGFTGSLVLQSNANGGIEENSSISTTELDYLNGVTSLLCGVDQACTFTNKTLVVSSNTITTAASGSIAATELNAAIAEIASEKTDTGTANEITLTGTTIGLADDPVLPGNGAVTVPSGTTAQQPGAPTAGMLRYNSDTSSFEGYTTAWGSIAGGGTALESIYEVLNAEDSTSMATDGWTEAMTNDPTFAINETTPLRGDKDYKITFASTSVGEYIQSPAVAVPKRSNERTTSNTNIIKFVCSWSDGSGTAVDGEIDFKFYDASNTVELSPVTSIKAGIHEYEVIANLDSTIDSVKLHIEASSSASINGEILICDSITFSDDPFQVKAVYGDPEEYRINGNLTQSTNNLKVPYFSTTNSSYSTISKYGTISNTSADGWSFTASRKVRVTASIQQYDGGTDYRMGIAKNLSAAEADTALSTNITSAGMTKFFAWFGDGGSGAGSTPTYHGSGSVVMESGDVIQINADGGFYVGNSELEPTLILMVDDLVGADHVARQEERQQAHILATVFGEGNGGTVLTADTTNMDFTEVTDTAGAWNGTQYTVQSSSSKVTIAGNVYFTANNSDAVELYINGTRERRISDVPTTNSNKSFDTVITGLTAGDVLSLRFTTNATLSSNTFLHYISIVEEYVPPVEEANVITTVLLPQSEENVFSARVAGTASSCNVTSTNADWISSCSRSAAGEFTINFKTNHFSIAPSCTGSMVVDAAMLTMQSVSATTLVVDQSYHDNGNPDNDFTLTCIRQGTDYKGTRVHVGSIPRNQIGFVDVHPTNYHYNTTSSTSYTTMNLDRTSGDIFHSVATNQLELPAGKFELVIPVGSYQANFVHLQIWDADGSTQIEEHSSVSFGHTGDSTFFLTSVHTTLELSAPKTIEFRIKTDVGSVASGFRYGRIKITKLND